MLDLAGVYATDGNASSSYTLARLATRGLDHVDEARTFSRDWRDPDQRTYWENKRRKCAEVLVPNVVPASYIRGAYVSNAIGEARLRALASSLQIEVEPDLFFA